MVVRSFEKDDESDFLRLCENFYSSGATTRGYNEELAKKTFFQVMSKHENLWGFFIINKDNESVAGYSLITTYWCNEDGGNVVIIDELYIEPGNRKKGLAQEFIKWIEEKFKDDAVAVTLEVITTNTIAKDLYAKVGYKEDGFQVLTKRLK